MDEFLSEKEQVERLREWWRENGWFLIGGAALGLLALFGYRQYGEYRTSKFEDAAGLYAEVKQAAADDDLDAARRLLEQLRADHGAHAYADQAALLVASKELVPAPDQAIADLREVMENSGDPELAMVARLRLARVLAYRERYQEALDVLNVQNPGEFAGRINEIRGDIHYARGAVDEARAAYLAALVADGSEVLDRSFLQMKLNDLSSGTVADAGAAPAPAPATDPAEPAPAAGGEPAAAPAPDSGDGA